MHLLPDPSPSFDGIRRDYTQQDVAAPVRPLPHPPHAGRDGRDTAVAAAEDRAIRADARRADRQPGRAAGQGGTAGDLPVRLAGRGRRQHRRPDVSGPVAVSGRFRAERGAADQQCAAPRRPDRAFGGRRRHLLDGADRGRRRGRVRRRAERVRADEGDDRGRRRRRAFRGPARLGEEVRPSRRQGAGADRAAHPHAERRPAGRRCRGRADRAAVPHRCALGAAADHRRRRARPPVHHRRAHRRRASSASGPASASTTRSPAAWPSRPMPTCCGGRPASRTSRRRSGSPMRSTGEFPGKMLAYNCSPSFNWRKKLSPERIASFQRDIGAMGYKFQFVTLAGFHSLNLSMFELARGYKERGMAAYSELQQAEFAAEADGLHRDAPPARGRRRLLRRGRDRGLGRPVVHDGVLRQHRGGAVPRRAGNARRASGRRRGPGAQPRMGDGQMTRSFPLRGAYEDMRSRL